MAERDNYRRADKETMMRKDRDWKWTQIEIVIISIFLLLAGFSAVTVGVLQKLR